MNGSIPRRKPPFASANSHRSEEGDQYESCAFRVTLCRIYHFKRRKREGRSPLQDGPSVSHPLSTGTLSCFRSISPLPNILPPRENSTMHTPTPNERSRTRSKNHRLDAVAVLDAEISYWQHRLEDVKSGALRALEIFDSEGQHFGGCGVLQRIPPVHSTRRKKPASQIQAVSFCNGTSRGPPYQPITRYLVTRRMLPVMWTMGQAIYPIPERTSSHLLFPT